MGASRWLFAALQSYMGTQRLWRRATLARRTELSLELARLFGDRVQSGPFAGMLLGEGMPWSQGEARPAKLLGTYESNLHAAIDKAVRRAPQTVVNVGCAEGYYAVGMARLLPAAKVFAFDTDPRARQLCGEAAAINGVADRVKVDAGCSASVLEELAGRPGNPLAIVDCEGGERDLLDPTVVPGLARCDIIVESHDYLLPGTTDLLDRRLSPTHDVEFISQGGRNPSDIAGLAQWAERDRWLLVDEDRPETMRWLACWARQTGSAAPD